MAAARITTIAGEIATLVGGMTTANGYHYNWGTINEPDEARMVAFPAAVIRYKTDTANTNPIHALYGMANAEFEIIVYQKITPSTTVKPEFTADGYLDGALADLMKLFSDNNTGYLPLSKEAVITYKSSEKITNTRGNTFKPVKLITKWDVFYHNS